MKISSDIKIAIQRINDTANKRITGIITRYAKNNTPYKVGDILRDHFQIGKVYRISYQIYIVSCTYEIVYLCDKLKKDLTPYKSKEVCYIHCSNIKEKISQ